MRFSAHFTTPEQSQQPCAYYEPHEGIQLDFEQMRHYAGKRTIAKLMLNSMCAMFGQRTIKI